MTAQEHDVVVIGAGSGGKPLAGELSRAGISVVVVERDLVGGECPYVACVPSKSMLISAGHHRESGGTDHAQAYAQAVGIRDRTVRHRDDRHATEALTEDGAKLVRGDARLTGRRTVTVGTADGPVELTWRRALVIATGGAAVIPPVAGLDAVAYWTSDVALSSPELPRRLLIMGGGPIGCELAQVYASFGTRVTLVQSAARLLPAEPRWVGAALAEVLERQGVTVRTGAGADAVHADGVGVRVRVGDEEVAVDRILVATGKKPRTSGFGLEVLGLATDGAVPVDARMHARTPDGEILDDVFAIGDVTGLADYTHTANYHARTVAAHLLGRGLDADHTGIPRVTYTDPAVFGAGLSAEQAADRGIEALAASFDASNTSRSAILRTAQRTWGSPSAYLPARVELVADAATGVLIGASALGPEADSWGAELALAVRTRMRVHDLAQALHAYPSWTEALHPPARELAEKISPRS